MSPPTTPRAGAPGTAPLAAIALPPAASLLATLARLIEQHRIDCVVHTGAADGELAAGLAPLVASVIAIEVRPELAARARARVAAARVGNVRVVQGHPPRVLADLRPQIPERTLYVLEPAAHIAAQPATRDEIFWVPRGKGVIAVRLAPAAGVAGYGDVQDQLLRWSQDHAVETVATRDGSALLVARPRPNVHVTFLIEKHTHEYGASGISINLDNLVATLDQTGLATWNVVHYDQCFHEGRQIPLAEIAKPPGADAHVLVCTCHYHSRANPSPGLLQEARQTGSKVAFVWLDKQISQSTPDWYRAADVNVVLDGNDFELPNAWPVFTPKNPMWFHDPGLERDIPVSLVGEVRYLSQRKAYASRLERETRIPVRLFKTSAADTGRTLAVAEYARLYQRSKISIALTKDSVRQLKGRVFEVLHCGALLLCDVNHHVSSYLEPGREYVVYRDYEDLVRKCAHYLEHEDERASIARAGHARVVRDYNHRVFWQGLLARCGASAASYWGSIGRQCYGDVGHGDH